MSRNVVPQTPEGGPRDPLIGRWFHSFNTDGEVEWQGRVRAGDGTKYVVQLYSWVDGDATEQKIVNVEQMLGWQFYETGEAMREMYDRVLGPRGDRIRLRKECARG